MQAPGAVSGTLHLGRFADAMYFLREEIEWTPPPNRQDLPVTRVPRFFVTDFASIPRAFWTVLPPDGLYTYPAIVHDYLYWAQPVTSREVADEIFKLAMEDFRIDSTTRNAIHSGVRFGGSGAWNENATLRKQGERRILKEVPTDPTITWAQWKERRGVFVD